MKLFFCFKIIACSLSVNMLKLVNLYRKYYDLEALKPIPKLQMASDLQANTMCKTKRLTHDGIKGRETVRKRAEAFNFIGLNVGENIAKQENDDYKEVFKMWLKSKGHRKNILGNYDYTAVTTCRARDGNRYWVQVFGKGKKNGNDQGDKSRNDQVEGTKGDGNKDDIDQGEETKGNETPSVINQLQENDQLDGEGSGSPNPLTSFTPLKSPNNQTEIQERFSEEEKPPISYETTISISRKYDKPSMVNTSTVGPMNPPLVNQDEESENMEFLFKEGEDTQKVLKKIPPNYHLSFKGNFRKYVAMKNKMKDKRSEKGPGKQPEEKPKPKDQSSKLPPMEPRFDQHKPQDEPKSGQRPSSKPRQPIFKPQQPKESSPKQQSPIKEKLDKLLKPEHPATPKPQQPKDKPKEAKLPDGNQVNGMFKTILDKIKKLEDKKNSGKLPSLTIDLPQIAQPTSAALSSSPISVIKSTTTQPPSTSTEVIYKTVYKYKDAPESSVKPKESTEKPKESTEKPKESTDRPKESTEKPKESTEKPKESSVKPSESTEKPKESTEKPKESTEKSKESTEKPKESTEKPKESTEKQKESTEKPKEPSSIAYKTTKIGSYSILDSESKIKTITVTVLKDSISPSSPTQSVSPSVSSVLDFIDKPGTTPDNDEENLGEFDSKVKKLFKDLIDTKKKRRLFRLAPNLEKDTESRLKDYVKKLIDSEDPIEKDGVLDCSVIDIGEPAVD